MSQPSHKVVGAGDSVVVLSKMNFGDTAMAVIDLFRVEDGLIVEHWDVKEEIPPGGSIGKLGKVLSPEAGAYLGSAFITFPVICILG